ncbi:MAG: DNA gyrase inhibitor YacG [Bdellovibrio sp.]|nr:DNA gyrase inhibitor YacG [Bdellovibrio sp.]
MIEIKCPTCGLLTIYSSENPSRPFCSERCKLIDLGQWADQTYKIPSAPVSIDTLIDIDDADEIEPKD